MNDYNLYIQQLADILQQGNVQISNIKPSEWTEANMIMQKPFPGPFRYSKTPYTREIVDCLSPDHPARWVAVMKGAQVGFALDSETDLPTPEGFVKMKDIKRGDYVLSEHGLPIKVTMATDLMHEHKCYKVVFTDGSEIVADADHLWEVYDLKNVKRVLSTEKILPRVKHVKKSGKSRNRYYIPNSKAIEGIEKNLPIDPYLLGLWLGDGCTTSNTITATKEDAIFYKQELSSRGIDVLLTPYKGQDHTYHVRVQNAFNSWKGGYNIYGNKHIPSEYFTASIQQRLDLLQGLIDTDGHVMKDGKVEFYNINKKLIEEVRTLIASLGYKVTLRERDNSGKKTQMHPTRSYEMQNIFVLNFMGYAEMPVAKLPRKRDRLKSIKDIRQEITKRWIESIEEVESRPVKCISVDSPTKLYLAGKSYIPTHNSSGVIYPGVGWIIKNNPGNTFITVGAPDLIEKSMEKLDLMIDACGIRDYIKPQVMRNRMNKSGDTNFKKEFPGGYVTIASANNHKAIRQVDLQYGFFDDFESVKGQSKESGDTRKLLEQRFAAYADTHKIFYISTPELKETSNIEPAYMLGDRRKYFVPCPCCGDFIELRWSIQNGEIAGGITYKTDDDGRLVAGSVGYICQSCGGFFNDKKKHEMLNNGLWKPTAEPSKAGYYSYQISSLYAPIGMYDWEHYVNDYIEANPIGQPRIEKAHKAFVNLCLGEPYEPQSEQISANSIQRNCREYDPCTIPEKLSISDGNGRILLITCAADMNGKLEDARLDYEVVAWSEKGASYSIEHGSIGTFVPREGAKKEVRDRDKWTYEFNTASSVWAKFDEVINKRYTTDTGRTMQIARSGLDCGYFSAYAYQYIDSKPIFPFPKVMGLKGKGDEQFEWIEKDVKYFVPAKERPNLYILTVGRFKDDLAEWMQLNWNKNMAEQHYGFMNFPTPSNGMYGFSNFFEHFESEHRVMETNSNGQSVAAWKKKGASVMNHMWDCRVYNMAVREIMMEQMRKELKVPKLTWREFCVAITGGK